MKNTIELLAPARDIETGRAAILSGADAVYIGADRFGARSAAGNSLSDIKQLVRFAHGYYARIYLTVNTILKDNELDYAKSLVDAAYEMNIDGLIIQDMAFLEMALPPIPLIASTQMNNATPAKVRFLEDVGFSRAILARELSLDDIAAIKSDTRIELECFIHGALCVAVSGQCYLSAAMGRRSGNRGDCAQPCRHRYTLLDQEGKVLADEKYLLSIRDMNRSAYLGELIDNGITSFKIEGRLKDPAYVTNVVSHYNQQLNEALVSRNLARSSSGESVPSFIPDPHKSFNRGFTTYNIAGNPGKMGAIHTPKSIGKYVGRVKSRQDRYVTLEQPHALHNGDGLCFFQENGEFTGTRVNEVKGEKICVDKPGLITEGVELFRNHDQQFHKTLSTAPPRRKIPILLCMTETEDTIEISGVDTDETRAHLSIPKPADIAKNKDSVLETIQKQLAKTGDTIFEAQSVEIDLRTVYFFPIGQLNQIRRDLIDQLIEKRNQNRPRLRSRFEGKTTIPYPETELDFKGNVLNEKAKAFYSRHGVQVNQPAAETGVRLAGEIVARTKYCVRKELNLCPGKSVADPLWLIDAKGNRFQLEFECDRCGMAIQLEEA